MKVCIATSLYEPYNVGGGEISAQNLAESLTSNGIDVVVLTIGKKQEYDFVNGVKVVRIVSPNIYWGGLESSKQPKFKKVLWHLLESYNFLLSRKLKRFFIEEKIDVLHVRNLIDISPYIWKVAKFHGVKVVNTLNNYACVCIKASMFKNGNNCKNLCTGCKISAIPKRELSKYVDAVIGVSNHTLLTHTKLGFFKNAKAEVIYTYETIRKKQSISKNKKKRIFGYIGRLSETKGVFELIENFNKLNKESELIIAGTGLPEYVSKCKDIANDKVFFLGKTEASFFFRQIDILIINSMWHEPFPRVLVESYSYGIPIISTNRGGTKELIKNGITGYVYNPKNEKLFDVLKKIEDKTEGQINIMSENCLYLVKSQKNSDIEQHIILYKRLNNSK